MPILLYITSLILIHLTLLVKQQRLEGEEPNMFINGNIPIDWVYATDNIEDEISMLSLSFHGSMGDQKTVILQISTKATIG